MTGIKPTDLYDFLYAWRQGSPNKSQSAVDKASESFQLMLQKTSQTQGAAPQIVQILQRAKRNRFETDNNLLDAAINQYEALLINKVSEKSQIQSVTAENATSEKNYKPYVKGYKTAEYATSENSHKPSMRGYETDEYTTVLPPHVKQSKSHTKNSSEKDRVLGTVSNQKGNDERVDDLEREVNDLRNRLSRFAGENLTFNNPAFADLSDSNRPTKVAESYQELYDNEWTEALEELIKQCPGRQNEKQAINELGRVLEESYEITQGVSKLFLDDMIKTVTKSLINPRGKMKDRTDLMQSVNTTRIPIYLQEFRRENAAASLKAVYQEYEQQTKILTNERKETNPKLLEFARKCVNLTWFMNVQDQPLVLKWASERSKFDTKYFREFTKRGSVVDFTAWPALLLHSAGPVLVKGVVEPKPE